MRRVCWLTTLLLAGAATMLQVAVAQEKPTGNDCHPDSVVLTHCDAAPPPGATSDSPADKAAREDARKKAELAAALERQRQRNAQEASRSADDSSDQLERAQVVGQHLHTPTAAEVFDGYFGNPAMAPDITQNTDQMGNRTECITHCVGPACCKTVLANPPSPGVINGNP